LTGEGQWVDVSAQETLAIVSLANQQYWNLARFNPKRAGAFQRLSGVRWPRQRRLWQCRDGFITFLLFSGHLGARGNKELTEWMSREGLAPECMKKLDWTTFDPQGGDLTDDEYEQIMNALDTFFRRHTKMELYEAGVKNRIVLYPCSTTEDLINDIHLRERNFWTEIEHPELGVCLAHPRPCVIFSQTSCEIRRRAPLVGEHNEEIYEGELGFSREQLVMLRERHVI
jgi:crotonobetainyl-CoA:carnitine CoA-transferase CaiB-like acyl-CoA transferase